MQKHELGRLRKERLCRHYRTMLEQGKQVKTVVTAIARELAGYFWDIACHEMPDDVPYNWCTASNESMLFQGVRWLTERGGVATNGNPRLNYFGHQRIDDDDHPRL